MAVQVCNATRQAICISQLAQLSIDRSIGQISHLTYLNFFFINLERLRQRDVMSQEDILCDAANRIGCCSSAQCDA